MYTKEKLKKLKQLHDWHMKEIEYYEQEIADWEAMELPEQVEQAKRSLNHTFYLIERYIEAVCND